MGLKQTFTMLDSDESGEYPLVKFRAQVASGEDALLSASKDCSLEEAEAVLKDWKEWYVTHGLVLEEASDTNWVGRSPDSPELVITGQILPRIIK